MKEKVVHLQPQDAGSMLNFSDTEDCEHFRFCKKGGIITFKTEFSESGKDNSQKEGMGMGQQGCLRQPSQINKL